MPDRFEKFSTEARRAFAYAQEEAQRFNHNYIGTEHLLLGLMRVHEGVAAHALHELGVRLSQVRSAMEFIIGRGDGLVVDDPGLSPRATTVIELAVDEARHTKSSQIGTEHLLLGLSREGEGIAVGVLESLGVSIDRVRGAVFKVLDVADPNPPPLPSRAATVRINEKQFVYGLALPPEIVRRLTQVMQQTNRSMDDLILEAIIIRWLQHPDTDGSDAELPPPQNDPPVQP